MLLQHWLVNFFLLYILGILVLAGLRRLPVERFFARRRCRPPRDSSHSDPFDDGFVTW